ncbi:unnamed protein product [Linum tenue]|uniref:F-box domain-containing protein n=1 Tax=Linum tenue TaxID=586396 RepID=A0AAV0M0W7_9ROSI|nr:unnamed protein product [Linum tenue]
MATGENPKRCKTKLQTWSNRSDHTKQQQKQQRIDEDRISNLPDNTLHDILCFLDSKSIFRTSILSKGWRRLVEALPYNLNFNAKSFDDESSFDVHVKEYLSRRNRSVVPVKSVTFEFGSTSSNESDIEMILFDTVMQYAAADGKLDHLSAVTHENGKFGDVAASIVAHRHCRSLEALVLKGFMVDGLDMQELDHLGFWSLTTLELHSCFVFNSVPFGLKHLKIVDCTWPSSGCLRIQASRLLDLEIKGLLLFEKVIGTMFALNLTSFRLSCSVSDLKKLSHLDFPSLDRATIRLWCDDACRLDESSTSLEDVSREYMKLLRGLHNAKSLDLRFDEMASGESWKDHFVFGEMKLCPFTRMETVRIEYQYPQEPPIPDHVIRYLFGGSNEFSLEQI